MKELLERLTAHPNDNGSESPLYDLAEIRQVADRCVDLPDDGVLAVAVEDGLHVSFVVFQFACGPSTRNDEVIEGAKMEIVFRGNGPSGSLRELRHTNWGKDGYLFYPSASVIAAAFEALEEWFDV